MRGRRRPMTTRSSAAMASPPATQPGSSRPRGTAAASTYAQPTDRARCTGSAAASSSGPGARSPSTIDPAARPDSSTSSPRASVTSVDGAPLTTAATSPAASASRAGPDALREGLLDGGRAVEGVLVRVAQGVDDILRRAVGLGSADQVVAAGWIVHALEVLLELDGIDVHARGLPGTRGRG